MGPTVVIVDDDAGFRGIARVLLTTRGFTVVGEAGDGEAALAVVSGKAPDCVLLDVRLPDVGGDAVACELLRLPAPPRILFTSTDPDLASSVGEQLGLAFVAKHRIASCDLAELFSSAGT